MTPPTRTYSRRSIVRTASLAVGSACALPGCLSGTDSDLSKTHDHGQSAQLPDVTEQPDPSELYVLQEGGVRWETLPVETTVGIGTAPPGVSVQEARDAIQAAMQAWNDVAGVPDVFAPPQFDDSLESVTLGNDVNEFVWSDIGDDPVGRANIRWDSETRRLEEVNIRLNDAYQWSTTSSDDAFDVQSLATHELGHHGLDDLSDPAAADQTMFHESARGNTKKRSLAAGDIAGWQVAYGDTGGTP